MTFIKPLIYMAGFLLCGQLVSQTPEKVAVLEPKAVGQVTSMNKRMVRTTLEDFISRSPKHELLDRDHTDKVLEELGFQSEGTMVNDEDQIKSIGRMLGADLVCVAEIEKDGNEVLIAISTINIETSKKVTRSDMVEGDSNANIRNLVDVLSSRLLEIESYQDAAKREEQARLDEERKRAAEEEKRANRPTIGGFLRGVNSALDVKDRIEGRGASPSNSRPGTPGATSGTVPNTTIQYEVSVIENNQTVLIRFVNTAPYSKNVAIEWFLQGSDNITNPRSSGESNARITVTGGSKLSTIGANTTLEIKRRVVDPNRSVNLGTLIFLDTKILNN